MNKNKVELQEWINNNIPGDEMIYKSSFEEQVVFIRDIINSIFYSSYQEYKNNPVMVINTHTSKSIKLPVYEIGIKKYGVKIILRYNMHDWKVSIMSEKELNIDFMGLFDEKETIHPVYCEGFQKNQVFQCFAKNKKQFTLEIDGSFRLYTFMYILNNSLNKIQGV